MHEKNIPIITLHTLRLIAVLMSLFLVASASEVIVIAVVIIWLVYAASIYKYEK